MKLKKLFSASIVLFALLQSMQAVTTTTTTMKSLENKPKSAVKIRRNFLKCINKDTTSLKFFNFFII